MPHQGSLTGHGSSLAYQSQYMDGGWGLGVGGSRADWNTTPIVSNKKAAYQKQSDEQEQRLHWSYVGLHLPNKHSHIACIRPEKYARTYEEKHQFDSLLNPEATGWMVKEYTINRNMYILSSPGMSINLVCCTFCQGSSDVNEPTSLS